MTGHCVTAWRLCGTACTMTRKINYLDHPTAFVGSIQTIISVRSIPMHKLYYHFGSFLAIKGKNGMVRALVAPLKK